MVSFSIRNLLLFHSMGLASQLEHESGGEWSKNVFLPLIVFCRSNDLRRRYAVIHDGIKTGCYCVIKAK